MVGGQNPVQAKGRRATLTRRRKREGQEGSRTSEYSGGVGDANWTRQSVVEGSGRAARAPRLRAPDFYRIKAGKLRVWNQGDCNLCCTQATRTVRNSRAHLLWDCPTTRLLWAMIGDKWAGVGLNHAFRTPTEAFSVRLGQTPLRAWELLRRRDTAHWLGERHLNQLYNTANLVWGYCCAVSMAVLRQNHAHTATSEPAPEAGIQAVAVTRLHSGLHTLPRAIRAAARTHQEEACAQWLSASQSCCSGGRGHCGTVNFPRRRQLCAVLRRRLVRKPRLEARCWSESTPKQARTA